MPSPQEIKFGYYPEHCDIDVGDINIIDIPDRAQIIGILDNRELSTREAARRTGYTAADFSRIRNADYGRFTLDRLIRILYSLDRELEVTLTIQNRSDDSLAIIARE